MVLMYWFYDVLWPRIWHIIIKITCILKKNVKSLITENKCFSANWPITELCVMPLL